MKPRWFRMKSAHFFRHKYMFTFLYNKPFTRYVAKIKKNLFWFHHFNQYFQENLCYGRSGKRKKYIIWISFFKYIYYYVWLDVLSNIMHVYIFTCECCGKQLFWTLQEFSSFKHISIARYLITVKCTTQLFWYTISLN